MFDLCGFNSKNSQESSTILVVGKPSFSLEKRASEGTALIARQGSVFCTQWDSAGLTESEEDNELSSPVELARGNVYLINTTKGWEEKLTEASQDCKMVVANFSAPWCGPCREIAPAYCELANKYSSMIFLTVDVDELTEFSTSWDIKAFPTFFFLKDGQEVDKLVGANKQELQMKTAAIADSTAKLCK